MDLDDMVGVAAVQQHGAGSANFCHSEPGAESGLTANRAKKRGATGRKPRHVGERGDAR
jgi:hypothetical protein